MATSSQVQSLLANIGQASWGNIVDRVSRRRRRCQWQDCEDAVEIAVLYAIKHPGKFDPRRGRIDDWIVGLAARRTPVRAEATTDCRILSNRVVSDHPTGSDVPDPSVLVRRAIAELSPPLRDVIERDLAHPNLRVPDRELASELGIASSTVRSRRYRARRKLRELLQPRLQAE